MSSNDAVPNLFELASTVSIKVVHGLNELINSYKLAEQTTIPIEELETMMCSVFAQQVRGYEEVFNEVLDGKV